MSKSVRVVLPEGVTAGQVKLAVDFVKAMGGGVVEMPAGEWSTPTISLPPGVEIKGK